MDTPRPGSNTNTFGSYLKQLLRGKMLQKELAERSELDAATISRLMSDNEHVLMSEETLYFNLCILFIALIKEHIITTADQLTLLVRLAHFRKNPLGEAKRKEFLSQTQEFLEHQQALERPKLFTDWNIEFIGRWAEITTIFSKFLKEGVRFLTLVGAPGVGKTELAIQIKNIAGMYRDFSTVHFLSLEGVKSVSDMLHFIRDNLPTASNGLILLILDNCEQIQDVRLARKEIDSLLKQHPHLFILATSQMTFSFSEYPIQPLKQRYDTITLFCEVARKRDNSFKLTEQNAQQVAALCMYLDGLPYAILIAASWVKDKTLDEVCNWQDTGELFDKINMFSESDRHNTLNNPFMHSYSLLNDQGQALFRRLGVFEGPCHFDSVKAVCNFGDLTDDIDNLLRTLSSHYIISFADNYIYLHNTTRHFAQKMTKKAKEEDQLRRQFVDYYYGLMCKYYEYEEVNKREAAKIEAFLSKELNNVENAREAAFNIRYLYFMRKILELYGEEEVRFIEEDLMVKEVAGVCSLYLDFSKFIYIDTPGWDELPKKLRERIIRINETYKRLEDTIPYPAFGFLSTLWEALYFKAHRIEEWTVTYDEGRRLEWVKDCWVEKEA